MTSAYQPLDNFPLCCPLDGIALVRRQKSFICAQGHSYDIAGQGYVNLLPVQLKASRDPGDSKAMVVARRQVVEEGHFETLSDQISITVNNCVALSTAGESRLVVDAGCGEGYYTARMKSDLCQNASTESTLVLGVDISKWAVMAAARRYSTVGFAVGTNKRLPVSHGSASIVTSLFGFESWDAWADLQTAGQWVITVDAGSRHLYELRQQIYPEVFVHEAPSNEFAIRAGYELVKTTAVTYTSMVKSSETIFNILQMTPHGKRVSQATSLEIHRLEKLELTIDTVVRVYRRC